jgi:hypothetical protein
MTASRSYPEFPDRWIFIQFPAVEDIPQMFSDGADIKAKPGFPPSRK